jgi:hypothetical protein
MLAYFYIFRRYQHKEETGEKNTTARLEELNRTLRRTIIIHINYYGVFPHIFLEGYYFMPSKDHPTFLELVNINLHFNQLIPRKAIGGREYSVFKVNSEWRVCKKLEQNRMAIFFLAL